MRRYQVAMSLVFVCALATIGWSYATERGGGAPRKPNVVIVLLDDVGFGALGSYGGLINTPNIDKVAARGLRYSNWHTTALCSPTRAALLTGRNHHSVGNGVITEFASDHPGYTGVIPKSAALLPRMLKDNGYATMAVGKWHNTPSHEVTPKGPFDNWPQGLGFEKFYGFMAGDTNNWVPALWDNEKPIEPPADENYHLTADIADKSIAWINGQPQNKPFMLYFAPGAGHAPHHAPKAYSQKYKGKFDMGWDEARRIILERQKQMGVVPLDAVNTERPQFVQEWKSLSKQEKQLYAHMMEVFAGFIEHTDAQVGRVLDAIEKRGELENTIVVIGSDNGASGEGGPHGSVNENKLFNGLSESLDEVVAQMSEIGTRATYNHYPVGWSHAMNAPLKYFKQSNHAGGVRDPFIIAWPGRIQDEGAVRQQFSHAIDVVPTLLEAVGVMAPQQVDGVKQKPIEGVSMLSHVLDAKAPTKKTVQYFEMFGNRGVWKEGWKAVVFHGRKPWVIDDKGLPPYDEDKWELYHAEADFSEANDLSAKYPEKVEELKKVWQGEAEKYQVLPLMSDIGKLIKDADEKYTKGRYEFTYRQGDIRIPEPLSPPVKNKSFSITADIVVPEGGCEGVLTEMGGRFGGYVLYCLHGKLAFEHNFVGEKVYPVHTRETLPVGRSTVRFEFKKTGVTDGITHGIGRLYLGSRLLGEGKIDRTVPMKFALGETLDIGVNTGTPCSYEYPRNFKFTGTIKKLTFNIAKEGDQQ